MSCGSCRRADGVHAGLFQTTSNARASICLPGWEGWANLSLLFLYPRDCSPPPRPTQVWHPGKYAAMLAPALRRHGMQAWLVNTGWTGGGAGAGARHDPRHIQAVVHAILSDALRGADLVKLPVLGLEMPRCVPGVPAPLMDPRGCWPDGEAYDDGIRRLAGLFAQVESWL